MNCGMRLILSWLLFFVLGQAQAKFNLYEAEVPVDSRSSADRAVAVEQAFKEVLLKLSPGQVASVDKINVSGDLGGYLRSYSYEERKRNNGEKLFLNVQFDERLVNRLATNNNLRLWTSSRPTTSVWVAMQDETGKTDILSVNSSFHARTVQHMEHLGKRWGLPIIFPLMDLEDQFNITPMDVWNQYPEPLEAAGKRYTSHAVLGAKVYQRQDGRWQGLWSLKMDDKTIQFRTQGFDVDKVMDKAFLRLSEELAGHYLATNEEMTQSHMILDVQNVNGIQAYARVMKYLERLKLIEDVTVHELRPDAVTVSVRMLGQPSSLLRTLKLDSVLQPENEDLVHDNAEFISVRYVAR